MPIEYSKKRDASRINILIDDKSKIGDKPEKKLEKETN